MASNIQCIDLCCGIGGMTCGLQQAGIKVVAGYDLDEDCRYAYEKNNNVPFYNKDLMKVTDEELKEHFKDAIKTYIHFSPPCQPYSAMTQKGSRLSDHKKYNIADRLFDLVIKIKPDFISIEEVPKVMNLKNFQSRVKELKKYYVIDQQIINIADWGAPQNRKRYFLVGKLKQLHQLHKQLVNKLFTGSAKTFTKYKGGHKWQVIKHIQ